MSSLWLPPGSVRAVMALAVVLTVCVLTAMGRIEPIALIGLAGAASGFYFGQKKK